MSHVGGFSFLDLYLLLMVQSVIKCKQKDSPNTYI